MHPHCAQLKVKRLVHPNCTQIEISIEISLFSIATLLQRRRRLARWLDGLVAIGLLLSAHVEPVEAHVEPVIRQRRIFCAACTCVVASWTLRRISRSWCWSKLTSTSSRSPLSFLVVILSRYTGSFTLPTALDRTSKPRRQFTSTRFGKSNPKMVK